ESEIEKLAETLLDEDTKMFERMRAVFSLRNDRSKEAVKILCTGFKASSALLRHELAYVLGQMQDSHAVPTLIDVLSNENEHVMVRHEAAEALGHKMLAVYARALDLPADFFDRFFTDPMWTTRNAYYPGSPDAEENQFGISPHRDHGFMTLLPLSNEPGLQIRTPEGEWIAAEQVDDAIIINTGEFMNRWTNGRFIATPHRVVPPRNDRYSIALFFNPNWDSEAIPLETCASAANPPQFEPVNIHDYLDWYIKSNFNKDGGGTRTERA
ncbi:MAG: hypothetical protein EBU57_06330, partial [Alphaproteobacteria bacterium]|nr:hypothetical protein [Alphaproteobacteria bacterium]